MSYVTIETPPQRLGCEASRLAIIEMHVDLHAPKEYRHVLKMIDSFQYTTFDGRDIFFGYPTKC
jgi:hypothetical protein